MASLVELLGDFAGSGRLEAILLRPARDVWPVAVQEATALAGLGLAGDRASTSRRGGGRRQITVFQAEHLPLIAAWTGHAAIDPATLRRNLVISGINLISGRSPLRDLQIELQIGDTVLLELTGPCDPCSKMARELGPGGYNAMRGHGGMTARVLIGGPLKVGDLVRLAAVHTPPHLKP